MVFLIAWIAARRRIIMATVLVGVLAGLGGIALTGVLRLSQHLAFGYIEEGFLAGVQQASLLRRIVALAVGGLVVGLGWWWLGRWARSEEVSVEAALAGETSRFRVLATVVDAVLQVIGVGAGASLGREGAPRQVGGSIASWLGERLELDPRTRRTLIACGAGAGLAAVYNVPISGVFFTMEVLLASVALRDLAPAVVTSVIATVITWPVLPTSPTYEVRGESFETSVLVWALVIGPVIGVAGLGFSELMRRARKVIPTGSRRVAATVVAFISIGVVATVYPQVLGNGRGPTQVAFAGGMTLALAAALTVLKPLATALCLAGGARGGLLTPSLSTGAFLGIATGLLWGHLWPGAPMVDFAVIGAAAMLAVTQRAPLIGIVLTLEFIRGGFALLPAMVVCVALATVTARMLDGRSQRVAGIGSANV